MIFTANLTSVADQTLRRVEGRGTCGNDPEKAKRRVVRYTKPKAAEDLPEFTLFKQRVETNPGTLFVVIADECHWGALQAKPHDRYVNDADLCQKENVVVLLVSATPYCLLTADSRLPKRVEANTAESQQCLDVHYCSWQDVIVQRRRFINDAAVEWLEGELQSRSAEPQSFNFREQFAAANDPAGSTYQSLDSVYLNPSKNLVRSDPEFEKLMQHEALQGLSAGKVLAVDYAFRMITHCDDWEQHVEWLAENTPVSYDHREVVKRYLVANDVHRSADGARELIRRWKQQLGGSINETSELIDQLLSPDKVRMQVMRVSDVTVGEKILSFLGAVRKKFGLEAHFELLGDFKDLKIKKEMDKAWFESLQRTRMGEPKSCQHFMGANRRPCDKGTAGRPCEEYQPPANNAKERKQCANCGHAHMDICSYEDLGNRTLLLILVAKGRLGDTFPRTFHCLDMRARYRTDPPSAMMSTLVQELGRLCRYSKEGEDRPYALISKMLYDDAMPKSDYSGSYLTYLLREHGNKLDSHMTLEHSEQWRQRAQQCQSIDELAQLMRECCKARDGQDTAVPDEDGASGGSKVICYDAGNRNNPKPYHERRLLLFAEPQIGKTGSFLGLIEVLSCIKLNSAHFEPNSTRTNRSLTAQVLRLRLTPEPEAINLDDISDDEEGDVPGACAHTCNCLLPQQSYTAYAPFRWTLP